MPEINLNKEPQLRPEKPKQKEGTEKAIKPEILEIPKEGGPSATLPPAGAAVTPKPTVVTEKSETQKEIEAILSENLTSIYQNLPDALRQQFKKKGEETATKIEKIINQAKIAVDKILGLIRAWLLIIPEINKFFLEREAKIKTTKILAMANKRKKLK